MHGLAWLGRYGMARRSESGLLSGWSRFLHSGCEWVAEFAARWHSFFLSSGMDGGKDDTHGSRQDRIRVLYRRYEKCNATRSCDVRRILSSVVDADM